MKSGASHAPDIGRGLLECVGLNRAAGSEITRIEVKDSPLAFEITQSDVLSPGHTVSAVGRNFEDVDIFFFHVSLYGGLGMFDTRDLKSRTHAKRER